MSDWLVSLTYNHLTLIAVDSNPARDFGIFHVRKLLISSVVFLRYPFVSEIVHLRSFSTTDS